MSHNLLGVGPIGWVNDDLRDWGADRDGQEVMAEIAAIGFDGTEMSYRFPPEPAELKVSLANHGLVLAAAYRWTNFTVPEQTAREVELARQHVDFCKAAGAKFATLAEGGFSQHWDSRGQRDTVQKLSEAGWELLVTALHEVGSYARSQDMRVTIHPHGGTVIESPDETDRLMNSLDPELVGLCYDSGHVLYGGGDPGAVAERWAGRIDYVHLKDVRYRVLETARSEAWDFATAVRNNIFCTPGAGMIDFDPVISALKTAGYEGWYVVEAEQDPARYDARTVSSRAFHLLKDRYSL